VIRVLIIDDDRNLRKVLRTELSGEGFSVYEAEGGIHALGLLEKDEYDVLLLDLNMPDLSGMDILKQITASENPAQVIILTAHATVPTAVAAMKMGAYDYVTKPFDLEQLKAVIEKAYEKKSLLAENRVLKTQIKKQSEITRIITKSPLMMELLERVKKTALSNFPVLVSGETGVGKELIARAVHEASKRSEGPFIPINCGAIPENMLESELFGYEKGAFTGAYGKKLGLLDIADHGTLFLDEISELTPTLQGKLLRVIESGRFFRVGGVKETHVDVRFISATNEDIKSEVEKGSFRRDLYYRISGITLEIPPLRERKEDILPLIENMIHQTPAFKNKKFSGEALNAFSEYLWPGNVRELQNVVHRTLLLSGEDVVRLQDLPTDFSKNNKTSGRRLGDLEREHILKVLKEAGGHKGKAAEILGVDPKTLYRKLLSYGVSE
jgi:DNA-binding NtrC family response regulator